MFREKNIKILRIGLHESEELRSGSVIKGPYHPAFGEIAQSLIWRKKIEEMITETKLYEMLKKSDQDKAKKTIICILAVVGAVVAIAGIAYAVYSYMNRKSLEEFEDEFGQSILKDIGLEGEYIGVGHLALGYADTELPPILPRRENRVYYVR